MQDIPAFLQSLLYHGTVAAELDWENLRMFAVMHRNASFLSAARAIGVDATTLSRRLTQLEKQLGVLLFQRTTNGLVPTEAAAKVADHVVRIERQIEIAREEATGRASAVAGAVRVALTDETAASFVIPRIELLRARHPDIDLDLVVSDRYVDLARGDADVAMRFQYPGKGVPADPRSSVELTTRRVGDMPVAVYASKQYLARRGHPKNAFEMEGHDLVIARRDDLPLPGAPWAARVRDLGRAIIRTEGIGSMRAAIVEGLGIGALPTLLVNDLPDLVKLGPPSKIDEREIWLVAPADLARVARVRAVWNFLVAICEQYRNELATGDRPRAKQRSPKT